jgi:hypothetical protein
MLADHPGRMKMLELVYVNFPVERESHSQDDGEKKTPEQSKIKESLESAGRLVVAHTHVI